MRKLLLIIQELIIVTIYLKDLKLVKILEIKLLKELSKRTIKFMVNIVKFMLKKLCW